MDLVSIAETKSATVAAHLEQRDWQGVAAYWHKTGGPHGLPIFQGEEREVIRAEAALDGVDIDEMAG